MTDIINDTSLENAFQQQRQQQQQQQLLLLKDVQCNNNVKSPSSPSTTTTPHSHSPVPVIVPKSKLIISNMESVIRSVKKQHVVKKKKRKIVEPEISDIVNILTNSLTFSNSEEKTLNILTNGNIEVNGIYTLISQLVLFKKRKLI